MRRLTVFAAVAALLLCTSALAAQPSVAPVPSSPFFIAGEQPGDGLAFVENAGDVDGDGREDLLISYANFFGASQPMSARAYVVFGDGTDAPVDLADLGDRGFAIDGPPEAPWSFDVDPGGDVDDDGRADILVSTMFADKGGAEDAGRVFVVFGKDDADPVDLDALGGGGYELYGPAHSLAGGARRVADLNGDDRDELLIMLKNPDRALLVFGKATTTPVALASLGGSDGYAISAPAAPGLHAGTGVGDVDGDGLEDLALTGGCGGGPCPSGGRTWISFGKSDTDPVDLSSLGGDGFVVTGNGLASVARVGDVNADGKADVGIYDMNASRAFVVFGRSATSALSLDALGSAGFRIDNADAIRPLGDIDGDGHADLAFGGDWEGGLGAVLYGKADSAPIDLANPLDHGFRLEDDTVIGVAATTTFGSGPRLAAAVADAPLGRLGAGSVRLFVPPAPSFELPEQLAYVAGGAIAPVPPTDVRRSSPLAYEVSPALPAGLALDPATGAISGTPTQPTATGSYVVRAADRVGGAQRTVSIRIDDPAYEALEPAAQATASSRPLFAWTRASAPDDTEPVAEYTVVVDGSPFATLPAAACQTRCELLAPAPLADGAHEWRVETTARDGHVRRTAPRGLTVLDLPTARLAPADTTVATGELVTWDASKSSDPNGGIARYEFDLDGNGSYERDGGANPRALVTYSSVGDRIVGLRVTDVAGNVATATARVHVAPAPPAGELGISINGGAIATNDPRVTLSLVWPYLADSALISNDGGFGPAGATQLLALATEIPWTLASSGPERLPKIVYLRFRGGTSTRETYTDDIILDERPPSIASATSEAPAGSAAAAASRAAATTIRVVGRDDNSGLRRIVVAQRRGGPAVASKRLVRAGRVGRKRVSATLRLPARKNGRWVRVVDVAGNASRWRAIRTPRTR